MTSIRAGDSTNRGAVPSGTLTPVPWPRIVLPPTRDGGDTGAARGGDGVVVVMSPDARARAREDADLRLPGGEDAAEGEPAAPAWTRAAQTRAPNGQPLSAEQGRQVEQLRARDTAVRAHEAAHLAASGGLGSSPSFDYALGPDGKRYAVGGEVSVDTSPGRTPEETIARARTLRAAATAPADPSAQDMAVAASAARMEAQARSALQEQRHTQAVERPGASSRSGLGDTGSTAPGRAPDGGEGATHDVDPDMTLLALTREQVSSRDGFSHNHQPDCGMCRRGATAYANR